MERSCVNLTFKEAQIRQKSYDVEVVRAAQSVFEEFGAVVRVSFGFFKVGRVHYLLVVGCAPHRGALGGFTGILAELLNADLVAAR